MAELPTADRRHLDRRLAVAVARRRLLDGRIRLAATTLAGARFDQLERAEHAYGLLVDQRASLDETIAELRAAGAVDPPAVTDDDLDREERAELARQVPAARPRPDLPADDYRQRHTEAWEYAERRDPQAGRD